MPHCPNHPDVPMICPACIGAAGGKVSSAAKTAACRQNGRKGGRPKGSKNKIKTYPAVINGKTVRVTIPESE